MNDPQKLVIGRKYKVLSDKRVGTLVDILRDVATGKVYVKLDGLGGSHPYVWLSDIEPFEIIKSGFAKFIAHKGL